MKYLKIAMLCSVVNFLANNRDKKSSFCWILAAILFPPNESETMTSHQSSCRRSRQKTLAIFQAIATRRLSQKSSQMVLYARLYSSHSTAPPPKTKVARTWLKIRQKRWNIPPTRPQDHVLAFAIGVPELIAKLCSLKRKASVAKR